jgi:hypothetical protein
MGDIVNILAPNIRFDHVAPHRSIRQYDAIFSLVGAFDT